MPGAAIKEMQTLATGPRTRNSCCKENNQEAIGVHMANADNNYPSEEEGLLDSGDEATLWKDEFYCCLTQ